jgi:DNA-directed RNA polymerase I, II, and III subunit RPABC1
MRKYGSASFQGSHYADVGDSRLLSILEEKSIQRGIIVFPGNMTPSARKVSADRPVAHWHLRLMLFS